MTDEMLRQAAEESLASYVDTITKKYESTHTFHPSPALEREIRRLARQAGRPARRKILQRVALVALTVSLACGAWLAVSEDARAEFVAWARQMFDNSVVYDFYGTYPEESLPEFVIDPPPEGFVETEFTDLETICVRVYAREDELIQFTWIIMSDESTTSLFSKGFQYEAVQVGDSAGDFYKAEYPDESNELIWFDEEQKIVFQISAFLEKDDMLSLANRVVKR